MGKCITSHHGKLCYIASKWKWFYIAQWEMVLYCTVGNDVILHNGRWCYIAQWKMVLYRTMGIGVALHRGKWPYITPSGISWEMMVLVSSEQPLFTTRVVNQTEEG